MRPSLRARHSALGFALLGFVGHARADEPNLPAREHFARGYALAEAGNPAAAIGEFEQAYSQSPNPSVLYNLGQAYAAAGRSSEAIDALQRYLQLGGTSVGEQRTLHVQSLIAYHAQRVGSLEIEVEPASAMLVVDGKPVGTGSRNVTLDVGAHGLLATAPGFEPASARVEMLARATTKLGLHLERRAAPATLRLACPLPDVKVFVDNEPRGTTPALASSVETSGAHRVRFARPGYLPDEHQVELAPSESRTVTCRLAFDPNDAQRARLRVEHPQGTQVFLDDAPFLGAAVPSGGHQVSVAGAGYATEARQLRLRPGEVARLTLVPLREPKAQAALSARNRATLRVGAYVLAGVGVAAGATAAVLYVDNGSRYAAWQANSRRVVSTLPSDPDAPAKLDRVLAEENSLRRRDSWALGLTVFSCTALATAAVVYFASRAPEDRLIVTAGAEPSIRYQHEF